MKKKLICLLSALMAFILALGAFPAFAETGRTAYVVGNTMPVYQMPNKLSKTLGVMAYGQSLKITAWKNGWAQVKNTKGHVGYCSLNALSAKDPNTLRRDVYVKEANTCIFAKPAPGYKCIAKVDRGARLNAVALTRDKKWVRVWNGKHFGYMKTTALSVEPLIEGTSKGEKIWIVGNKAQIPTIDYLGKGKKLGHISHGQSYELLFTEGNRSCLRNANGKIGWVPSSCISKTNPNTLEIPMYARSTGNYLYSNIDTGAGKKILKGTLVTVVALTPDGNWSRVKIDGKYYYMESDRLSIIEL